MCYAIPGRVIELKGKIAVIDYFGEQRKAITDGMDVQEGDYVYAQGGVIVQKIAKNSALLILDSWKDRFFKLKQLDKKISHTTLKKGVNREFLKIMADAENDKPPGKKEMLQLLKVTDKKELEILFKTANGIRQKRLENSCCVH